MRVLLSAAFLIQAIAFLPAHADDRSLHATTDQAAACIAITDELKRMKFDGDFDRLVGWWKLNKVAQHQELDRVKIAAN
jgi:hypothetical protein